MESEGPMMLPKGIIRNTDETYATVASYSVVPGDVLYKYWHVYTNTSRHLVDPTDARLENFWWHVLGSDRRNLSGKTLARLFEDISTGPTVLPLRGPPNRYEGPSIPRGRRQPTVDSLPLTAKPQFGGSQRGNEEDDASSPDKTDSKDPSASSARPPPPHPILKKSRGPSASGPRPTARFVSPHGSGAEEFKDEATSSGSTAATGLEMRAPPRPTAVRTEKRSTPTGKKFVASSSSKRRPVLPRRPSSQSSAGSDFGSREGGSGSSSKYHSGQRFFGAISEQPTGISQDTFEPSTKSENPGLSAKAAGKRPAKAQSERKLARSSSSTFESRDRPLVLLQQASPAPARPSSGGRGASASVEVNRSRKKENLASSMRNPAAIGRGLPTTSQMTPLQPPGETQSRPWEITSANRPASQGLIASSVTETSRVAAQGQFDFEHPAPATATSAPRDIPDVALSSRPSSSSLFAPTQPSPTPAVPLGRSKSQLTLLLAREKDRYR